MRNYKASFVYDGNGEYLANQMREYISECVATNEGGNNWTITFTNCVKDEDQIAAEFEKLNISFVKVEEIEL